MHDNWRIGIRPCYSLSFLLFSFELCPQIGEDQREFMDIINDMIFAIQELSFALAEVDANEIAKVDGGKELLEAAKNVVKAGSRFHKFIKKRLRRPR